MFELVKNMTNEEGEDTLIDAFVGHFELDLTDLDDGPEWTDDSSMRFCLQLFPKYTTDGTENKKGVNSEFAERYRMRFFNKQLSEFSFHPQVGDPFKIETDSEGNEIKRNLDWNHRTYPEDLNKDFLDKLCSMEFDPKLDDTQEKYYIAPDLADSNAAEVTEGIKKNDPYGIAVTKQVINGSSMRAPGRVADEATRFRLDAESGVADRLRHSVQDEVPSSGLSGTSSEVFA